MTMLDNWIAKKIDKQLKSWLDEKEKGLLRLSLEKDRLQAALDDLSSIIAEIEPVCLKIPVEEYLINSNRFQFVLEDVKKRAMRNWGVPEAALTEPNLSSIHGIVTKKKPFQCTINPHVTTLMIGLKVYYNRKDHGKFLIKIGSRYLRAVIIGQETQQVVFPSLRLLEEDMYFEIKKLEGSGTLKFSVIGATITTRLKWDQPEFELRSF